jgi:hypothetical protein
VVLAAGFLRSVGLHQQKVAHGAGEGVAQGGQHAVQVLPGGGGVRVSLQHQSGGGDIVVGGVHFQNL